MNRKTTCIRAITATLAALSLGLASTQHASAATITENRINTPNLQIPTFNTALGTLQSVQLNITLLPGQTTTVIPHSHTPSQTPITSSNTISADSVTPFPPQTFQTTLGGGHSHNASTPTYNGGGLSISPFNVSVFSETSHNHNVTITYNSTQEVDTNPFGPDTLRVRANVIPASPADAHNHNHSASNKILNYSGASLTPFLAVGDISILAGQFSTDPGPSHGHVLAPFSFPVNTDEGVQIVSFLGQSFSSYATQSHTINPNFTTTATFTYEPIPEPASAAVIGLGALTLLRRRKTVKR